LQTNSAHSLNQSENSNTTQSFNKRHKTRHEDFKEEEVTHKKHDNFELNVHFRK
jgi:hypothetical protein